VVARPLLGRLGLTEVQGGLLQRKKQCAGALRLDTLRGKGVDHLEESDLQILGCLQGRKMQAEGFSAAADTGELLPAHLVALVEVTKLLSAKGGGTTKNAIGLAMAAGRTGHEASNWLALRFSRLAFRSSPKAESQLKQAAHTAAAKTNTVRVGASAHPHY